MRLFRRKPVLINVSNEAGTKGLTLSMRPGEPHLVHFLTDTGDLTVRITLWKE